MMPLPAIVHWEGNHWIVLYDVQQDFVRVADPAMGLRKIPRREFEAKWTGYTALFDYTIEFENAPGIVHHYCLKAFLDLPNPDLGGATTVKEGDF